MAENNSNDVSKLQIESAANTYCNTVIGTDTLRHAFIEGANFMRTVYKHLTLEFIIWMEEEDIRWFAGTRQFGYNDIGYCAEELFNEFLKQKHNI